MKPLKIISYLTFSIALLFAGCQFPTGKGTERVNDAKEAIANVEGKIADNNEEKLKNIGLFAYGTNFSLTKLYEYPSFEQLPFDFKSYVGSAITTNNFVRELAPAPDAEKMVEMETTIKNLGSDLEKERKTSLKKLTQFEESVKLLNKKSSDLEAELKIANEKFKDLTVSLGKEVDQLNNSLTKEKEKSDGLQTELDKFDEGFGWYAMWHGVKVFFKKVMWITIGCTALFFILKIFAASNPIAGSIFSVFESIIGFFIKGLFSLFPKAVAFSGNIDLPTFNTVKSSRDKIIDTIESLYQIEKATPGKTFTLNEVFVEFEKNMNDSDKKEIKSALEKLGWK